MNEVLRDIEFNCDKCGQRLVVDEKYAGMSVDCPKCQANLPIPYNFQCSECSFKSYRDFSRCPDCGGIGPGPLGDLVRREKETLLGDKARRGKKIWTCVKAAVSIVLFVIFAMFVWILVWILGRAIYPWSPMILLVLIVIFVSSTYLFKYVKRKKVEGAIILGKDSEKGVFPSQSSQELETHSLKEKAVRKKSPSSNALSDFFAFRMMVSSILARIIYLLGAIVITTAGFVVMFRDYEEVENLTWEGLIIIVGGNLVWRIACEIWSLIFSIHDRLVSIERSLKQK